MALDWVRVEGAVDPRFTRPRGDAQAAKLEQQMHSQVAQPEAAEELYTAGARQAEAQREQAAQAERAAAEQAAAQRAAAERAAAQRAAAERAAAERAAAERAEAERAAAQRAAASRPAHVPFAAGGALATAAAPAAACAIPDAAPGATWRKGTGMRREVLDGAVKKELIDFRDPRGRVPNIGDTITLFLWRAPGKHETVEVTVGEAIPRLPMSLEALTASLQVMKTGELVRLDVSEDHWTGPAPHGRTVEALVDEID